MKNIGAVLLAGGKGSRMNSKIHNKVVLTLGNKPMILHSVELLIQCGISPIIVVVGFAKQSVIDVLTGKKVIFANQRKRLGTAHALFCAMKKIPPGISDLVVLQGDDSAFYTKDILKKLIRLHSESNSSATLLTIEVENPFGLGRIVRNKKGEIIEIVEEKDATEEIRGIKEINPACYVFNVKFLTEYLKKIKKSPVSGEYYLTNLIELALKNNKKVNTLKAGNTKWRGVNTPDEFKVAKRMFLTE